MPRYTKSYSNYVHRKMHTTTNEGTIFERDWGTLGERHVIEPGKKRIYSDGNFLFTDNLRSGLKKRLFCGEWSGPYTLNDIGPNVNDSVNDTSILGRTNDLRDYAYYGSASEFVRATIENIIRWFPGRFYSDGGYIERLSPDGNEWLYLSSISSDGSHNYELVWGEDSYSIYTIKNPFEIDFHTQNPIFKPSDNRIRNMPVSWKQYVSNGAELASWNVWTQPYTDCLMDYDVRYEITYTLASSVNCVKFGCEDENGNCTGDDSPETVSDGIVHHIWGINYRNGIIWCTDTPDLDIHPSEIIIENYFKSLKGIEAQILNRGTNPQFTSSFVTPFKPNDVDELYQYIVMKYTWPSTGYCIDVGTVSYFSFVKRLTEMASEMDELWCDNLWRNMTHEAIQHFDWTYRQEYEEEEEVENILGGTRMYEVLHVMGRLYDDVKRYIDAISLKNAVTYDGIRNTSEAELSDRAELNGWEVFSTKSFENENIILGDFVQSLGKIGSRFGQRSIVDHATWYNTLSAEYVSQNDVDNNFMRKLVLSSGEIFRTKGTRHSIDMVMGLFGIGDDDYEIEERYYSVEPKRRDDVFWFYEPVDEPYDTSQYVTIDGFNRLLDYCDKMHFMLDSSCPPHVLFDEGYFDLRGDMTVGEFCTFLNDEKNVRLNYPNEEFSGIPIKDVYIDNQHCIVPYFTQTRLYDGNVQFETRGGWGKLTTEGFSISQLSTEEYNYLETVPYMETVQSCGELLGINMYDVKGKKIYYVVDISDLSEYTQTVPPVVSHFFKLAVPSYPNLFGSWRNVPMNLSVATSDEYDDYCNEVDGDGNPVRELCYGVTYEDYKLAEYLDSIRLDNIGNNPHVGFGRYDCGIQYRQYLEKPFKYIAENYGFSDFNYCNVAEQFRYEVTEHCGEKIKNLVHGDDTDDEVLNFGCSDDVDDCIMFSCNERYYEPRKLLIIKNNIDSDEYREYFMKVIIKYLLQVIASTTILVLVGFKPGDGSCLKFSCETDNGGSSDDSGGSSGDSGSSSGGSGGSSGDSGGSSDDSGGSSGGSGSGGSDILRFLRVEIRDPNDYYDTSGDGVFGYNEKTTIHAVPHDGVKFISWVISDGIHSTENYSNPATITVKSNLIITINGRYVGTGGSAGENENVTLTFKVSPANSGPTIQVNDLSTHHVQRNIKDEYTITVPNGTAVMFRAAGTPDYEFSHWSGGSNQNPSQITATSDRTITAYFNEYEQHTMKWLSTENESELSDLSNYSESQTFTDYYLPFEVPIPNGVLKQYNRVVVPKHNRVVLEYFNTNGEKATADFSQDSSNFSQGMAGVQDQYKVQWYNFNGEPQYLETGEGIEPPKLVVQSSIGA